MKIHTDFSHFSAAAVPRVANFLLILATLAAPHRDLLLQLLLSTTKPRMSRSCRIIAAIIFWQKLILVELYLEDFSMNLQSHTPV